MFHRRSPRCRGLSLSLISSVIISSFLRSFVRPYVRRCVRSFIHSFRRLFHWSIRLIFRTDFSKKFYFSYQDISVCYNRASPRVIQDNSLHLHHHDKFVSGSVILSHRFWNMLTRYPRNPNHRMLQNKNDRCPTASYNITNTTMHKPCSFHLYPTPST